MVGGTTDNAVATTPSLSTSQLLDFAVQPLAWVQEQMSAPRVMPDGVLLPDGTVVSAADSEDTARESCHAA